MRKWVIVMVMCWLSTSIQADWLENIVNVVVPGLNIASELNTIPSKDAQKVKSQIYQVKRFSDQSVKDNIFDYIPSETKQQLQSLNYISRELEQIIGQDYMGNLDGWLDKQVWLNTSIKDFDFRTKEQKKFEESISKIQDDITNDVTKNTAIIALLAGENIKNQSEINSHLEYLAETTKKEQEQKAQHLQDELAVVSLISGFVNAHSTQSEAPHPIKIDIEGYLDKLEKPFNDVQEVVLELMLLGCFVIALFWYYIKSNIIDSTVSFPFIPLIAHCFVVVILVNHIDTIFSHIIALFNALSEAINPAETFDFLGEAIAVAVNGIGLKQGVSYLILGIATLLFKLAKFVLINLQQFLLVFLYCIAPFVCVLSLLPLFRFRSIGVLFVYFIQISSWSFFKAILMLVYSTFSSEMFSMSLSSLGDVFHYLMFSLLAVLCSFLIPKLASKFVSTSLFFSQASGFQSIFNQATISSWVKRFFHKEVNSSMSTNSTISNRWRQSILMNRQPTNIFLRSTRPDL